MRWLDQWWRAIFVVVLLVCGLAPVLRPVGSVDAGAVVQAAPEWPREWEGQPLRPLALSPVEQRFADRFPGHIARLTDGNRVLVMRQVRQPTRMLHPAADCYRGLGFDIAGARLERDGRQRLWHCFDAMKDGRRLRVCERIEDAKGQAFTDASSWFWAAELGQSPGPWLAVTVVGRA